MKKYIFILMVITIVIFSISSNTFACVSEITESGGELCNGNYTLNRDILLVDGISLIIPEETTVNINLNGFSIIGGTPDVDGSISYDVIINRGTLTIEDSSSIENAGSITHLENCHGRGVFNQGTLYFESGKITNNISGNSGAGIYNEGILFVNGGEISYNHCWASYGGGISSGFQSKITINGGIISNNFAVQGGGIYITSKNAVMEDGVITENTATDAGGVFVDGGSFILKKGTISRNKASYRGGGILSTYTGSFTMEGGEIIENTSSQGGGIYHDFTGSFILSSGSITNNEADFGGGIYLRDEYSCDFQLSGDPIIDGNFDTNRNRNNLYRMSSTNQIKITGSLREGARISVSNHYDYNYTDSLVFTSDYKTYNNESAAEFFHPDNNQYCIYEKDNEAVITKCSCGTNVAYVIKGNTIYFSKADSDTNNAEWGPDCGAVFKDDPNITVVKINDPIHIGYTNTENLFSGFQFVQEMYLSKLNVRHVTNLSSMFNGCRSLVTLDLSDWETFFVTNSSDMFTNCNSLAALSLGKSNKNIFNSLPNYYANWYYITAGADAVNPLKLGTQKNNGSLFETYDKNTMAGLWSTDANYSLRQNKLVLPTGLQEIGEAAFERDISIDEIILPDGLTTIGSRAFADCDLKAVHIPDSVTMIDKDSFYNNTNAVFFCKSEYGAGALYARENNIPYWIEP